MPESIVRIEELTFEYALSTRPALKSVSCEIAEGEYVAIMGACGAGKTTLCLAINGIVPHMVMGGMSGKVTLAGQDTASMQVRELARTAGMVFDNPEFQLSQVSVREEIALGLESLGVARTEMLRRIEEVLEIVGLSGLEDRSPMALSGGQQQRLAIAAALAMYPRVLVLDEPTSNLDPVGKEEVFAVAARLNRERGMTILIAEHEVEAMAAYADRIILLHEGEIVLNGTPSEVLCQVNLLERVGARAPHVTELAHVMAARNVPIGDYPVTLEQAEKTFAPFAAK